jgi:hypothetical protein
MAVTYQVEASSYGARNSRYAFAVHFTSALSSRIKYECYDNNETWPSTGTDTSIGNDIFNEGASSSSMISLIDTTSVAPMTVPGSGGATWKPAAYMMATTAESNPNRMRGIHQYVEQDGSILADDEYAYYNMVIEVPSSAATNYTMGFDLLIRYTYTGTEPTVSFCWNEPGADWGGDSATPVWATVDSGPHGPRGVKHGRSGSSVASCYANIPADTAIEDTVEAWVVGA